MSAYPELDNWNPMADDYSSTTFNSYDDALSAEKDLNVLYIYKIPASLTQDEFEELCSGGKRKMKSCSLKKPLEDRIFTIGFCTFGSKEDAREALLSIDNKPPYHIRAKYANKKIREKEPTSDNATFSNCSSLPPKIGRGRGDIMSNALNSAKELNKEKFSNSAQPNNFLPRGRGCSFGQTKIAPMKIVFEAGKRTTYEENSQNPYAGQNSATKSDLPSLVPILCTFCKKSCQLSCEVCRQPYCSSQCQEEDWLKHKNICEVFVANHENLISPPQKLSDSDKKEKGAPYFVPKSVMKNFASNGLTTNKVPTSSKPNIIKAEEIEHVPLDLKSDIKVRICNANNPSCFWVQKETAIKIVTSMEKELFACVEKKTLQCDKGFVCSSLHKEKIVRVKVIEITSNCSKVELIDYGGIISVPISQLWYLPERFKVYPSQAICCNLVDSSENKKIEWSPEEVSSFQCLNLDVCYKAHVYRHINKIYDISLYTDTGASVYSMIVLPSHSLSNPPNENITVPGVMSICNTWQQDCKFNVIPMELEADKLWGILSDGLNATEKLTKIENELKDLKTEEVNLKIEEGEIAAALSPAYQSYFRCMVLQRLKNSFKVIYIDYGNKEVVNCLRKLPETLLKEPSYVVCLEKPQFLSAPDFKSLFQTENNFLKLEVIFKSIKNDRIEFLVKQNNGGPLILPFFPWYHGLQKPVKKIEMKFPSSRSFSIKSHDSEMSKQSCKKAETNLQLAKPSFIKSSVSPNSTPIMKEKKIMIYSLPQESNFLSNSTRYSVIVTYLKNSPDSPELFIQFEKDKNDISSLCSQLNQHCCALSNNKYVPIKNEVICCKFPADNSWYRGQVIEKVNDDYRVFFIDYGNEDLVHENYIQPLPEKFALRKFSHSVCVKGIIPTKLPQKLQMKLYNDLWDMEVKDAKKYPTEVMLFKGEKSLIDLMNFDKHTKSSLKYQKLPANVQSEVLVCYPTENKLFLNQVKDLEAIKSLCEKLNSLKTDVVKNAEVNNVYCGLASDELWYRVFVVKVLSPSSVRVHFIDFGNEEDISTSNLKDLPKELFSLPVYCICVIATNIVVSKLDFNKEYTVEVVDDKTELQHVKFLNFSEKPKLPTISSMKTLSLPKNEPIEITLCHFEEGIYYVQMISSQDDVKALALKLQRAPEFLEISDLPKQDDVICAKCSDGLWYRGAVTEVSEKKICKIYFLDYGNLETVTLDNIKVLPIDLYSFPIFSVPVKISNSDVLQSLDDPTSPLKIKVVGASEDNVQVVEIDTEPIQKDPVIETRLLSDLPVEVGISHRENDIYYVQRISDLEKLSEMLNSLQVIERKNIVPSIGNLVCAKFQGGIYRGIIQNKCPNNSFKVFFIDYGNVDIVNIQDIFRIPSKYACEPMFSIAVRFVNTIPKLEVDSRHIVKNIGMCDKIHEVKYCKAYTVIEFSSMQTSTLSKEPVEVHFLSQEGEFYNVIKICDFSIKSELVELLKNFSGQEIHHIPIVGEVLLVKSKDQSWNRGCVKEVQETVCKMHLFDLGTIEEVPTSNMAYMPDDWKKYPTFTIKIALEKPNTNSILLTNLKVSVVAMRDGGIPVVKILQQFRYSDMKHYFLPVNELRQVIFFHKEGDILYLQDILSAVNYSEVQTEIAKCIRPLQHIPSEGEIVCAQSTLDGFWYRGCVKELLSNGQYKVHFIDFGNSENISKLNLKECTEKLVSYPVYSVAVKLSESTNVEIGFEREYTVIAEKESQNKVQTIKLVSDCEVHMNASTENTTKIENDTSHSVIKSDQNLNVSSCDKFYLSDCVPVPFPPGNQEIIIYYIHDFPVVSCAPYNKQALHDTVNLLQEMKTFCDDLKSDTYNGNTPPKVGEMVLAKYEDGMWYRATVFKETLPSYELLFVDYGNMDTTSLSSMRKMEKKFMNLNLQVHMCELEGFKFDEEKTSAVNNELQSFINKPLEANVSVSADSTITVNIPKITKHLVNKGLATVV